WKRTNPEVAGLYVRRYKGESLALRALFKFYLLRNHGGVDGAGNLLGIPLYNHFLESQEDFALPRATFEESIQSIYADIDEALQYMPMDFGNISDLSQLEGTPYSDVTSTQNYNDVFGESLSNVSRVAMYLRYVPRLPYWPPALLLIHKT